MTKQELITEILKRFTGTPDEYEGVRASLPTFTVAELERFLRIKIAQAEANAAEERLINTQAEIAANNFMWQLKLKERYEKKREAEAKRLEPQDRRVFETEAKKYGWAIHEANFDIARRAVGYGFSEIQLVEVVNNGTLSMQTASPAALAEYARERAEQRADYLQNHASPAELRAAAVQETAASRAEAARQHDEAQVRHREELDGRAGFPPLPKTTETGEEINASYLNKISATNLPVFKQFCRKYGFSALTRRLNGQD